MFKWAGHRIETDRFMLHYGHLAAFSSTVVFMKTVDGVVMSATRGFTMPRAGWIVSHSVTLNVDSASGGTATIRIQKNGVVQGSANLVFTSVADDQSDHVNIPLIRFEEGDELQAHSLIGGTITCSSVTGMIEIELER